MTKIAKHNEVLTQLKTLMAKEAEVNKEAKGPTASGVPGQDTNYTSVSESTDKVKKNEQGKPEDNPQDITQTPTKDSAAPAKSKKAENDTFTAALESTDGSEKTATALGKEILALMSKLAQNPVTTGTSVSEDTEKVHKNEQGKPEKNPQAVDQQLSKNPSKPANTKSSEEQEDIDKIASFEWGRQVGIEMLKSATVHEYEMYKQAGRRDFETLITHATTELEAVSAEKQGADTFYAIHNAQQKQGADTFYALHNAQQTQQQKQASVTTANLAVGKLYAKIASLQSAVEKQAAAAQAVKDDQASALKQLANEEKRAQEITYITDTVTQNLLNALRKQAAE